MSGSPFNPVFRRSVAADAPAISTILDDSARRLLAPGRKLADAGQFLATITPEATRERLEDSDYHFDVATDAGVVVGFIGMRQGTHLYHLFVARSHRRLGIAKRLFALVLERLEAAADGPFEMTVNASRDAAPFYEARGFSATAEWIEQDGVTFLPMKRAGTP
jgi:GNAT superfamily N-acetyltransferase